MMEPARAEQGAGGVRAPLSCSVGQTVTGLGMLSGGELDSVLGGDLQLRLQNNLFWGGEHSGAIQGAHTPPFLNSFKSWVLGFHLSWILTPGTKDLDF